MNKVGIKTWEGDTKKHRGIVLDSVNGHDVIECEACGFKHIIPIPSDKVLHDLYREEYYTAEKPLYFKRMEEDLDWWNITYTMRLAIFEKYLSKDRRQLLDIGSGPGYFLLQAKKRGWDGTGIEPSRQASAYSKKRGLTIIESFLNKNTAKELGGFDVIHMSEVMEHLPDPFLMIQLSYDLLRPGGLVCVVSPNDYSPLQKLLRKDHAYKPWWVVPPHHINYFDFGSIARLLQKNSFDVIEKIGTFPMEFFLLAGENYVGNDVLGRAVHEKRKNFETNLYKSDQKYLEELYRSFAQKGIGREFIVIGKKK
ncbi:MAG: class I SAM-dependent methyltransferase [bacterium]|nr:class I SAM-dependent methyltransferase [bacterium]